MHIIHHSLDEATALATLGIMAREGAHGDHVQEASSLHRVVLGPHPLHMQVDRQELQRLVGLRRGALEGDAVAGQLLDILLGLRVVLEQAQVLLEQVHLPPAPLAAKLAHPRDLLQQLLLALDPYGEQLLGQLAAQARLQQRLLDTDVRAQGGVQPVGAQARIGAHPLQATLLGHKQPDSQLRRQRLGATMGWGSKMEIHIVDIFQRS